MREVPSRPLFTETFGSIDEFRPAEGSAYFYGTSAEERSAHSPEWEARTSDVTFVRVVGQEPTAIEVEDGGGQRVLPLRGLSTLRDYLLGFQVDTIYVDITGLAHNVWAPLVRAALVAGKTLKAVYVEPSEYRRSTTPTEGELFALTERIGGVAPLPGFASLVRPDEDFVFVPLLGFEGARLRYVVEQVQPTGDKMVPVVGVPGFRPEYPFHAYLGNRGVLENTRAWRNVQFARANCPFSLYFVLQDISRQWPDGAIKIAPIGTKPHALGAVLFFLLSARPVELVYDHPARRAQRTRGSSRVCLYHISSLHFGGSPLVASV